MAQHRPNGSWRSSNSSIERRSIAESPAPRRSSQDILGRTTLLLLLRWRVVMANNDLCLLERGLMETLRAIRPFSIISLLCNTNAERLGYYLSAAAAGTIITATIRHHSIICKLRLTACRACARRVSLLGVDRLDFAMLGLQHTCCLLGWPDMIWKFPAVSICTRIHLCLLVLVD